MRAAGYYYEVDALGIGQPPWTGTDVSRALRAHGWTMHAVPHNDFSARWSAGWSVSAWWYINDAAGNEVARAGEPAKALERALAKVRRGV